MRDKNGEVREVLLTKAQADRPGTERVHRPLWPVVDGQFIAGEMLMKCPSKYNEQSHSLAEAAVDS